MARTDHITINMANAKTLMDVGGWAGLRRLARANGAAGVCLVNGGYRLLYMQDGQLRQKSWGTVHFLAVQHG